MPLNRCRWPITTGSLYPGRGVNTRNATAALGEAPTLRPLDGLRHRSQEGRSSPTLRRGHVSAHRCDTRHFARHSRLGPTALHGSSLCAKTQVFAHRCDTFASQVHRAHRVRTFREASLPTDLTYFRFGRSGTSTVLEKSALADKDMKKVNYTSST